MSIAILWSEMNLTGLALLGLRRGAQSGSRSGGCWSSWLLDRGLWWGIRFAAGAPTLGMGVRRDLSLSLKMTVRGEFRESYRQSGRFRTALTPRCSASGRSGSLAGGWTGSRFRPTRDPFRNSKFPGNWPRAIRSRLRMKFPGNWRAGRPQKVSRKLATRDTGASSDEVSGKLKGRPHAAPSKFRPLAGHGTPGSCRKRARCYGTRRRCRNGDRQRWRRRVL